MSSGRVGSSVKRIVFFGIILILVFRAHGKTAPTAPAADVDASYAVTLSGDTPGATTDIGVHGPSLVVTPQPESQGGPGLADAVMNMSEPSSLALLGLTLLLIVRIGRRLPDSLRQRQFKIRSAWQVVSGFFF